ncbi:MAG TPA: LpqN/LpqT family lipoprotein [Mycobacterium sp.]|nr:LpqN/LpqT family lipoprotein [Mycobacterium sp.]
MRRAPAVAIALAVLVAGCAPKPPDYQSLLPSSSPKPTATTPQRPVTIAEYLQDHGVNGVPMTAGTLTEIKVSMPCPAGWSVVNDPQQEATFEVIRETSVAAYQPTAMLMVFKLLGNFDVAEAIRHGYGDAQLTDRFNQLDASMADFHGMPSAMIEGSYNMGDQRLHTYNRIVIATGPPPANQRYLVQFSVSTAADQAQAQGADVESIIKGFTVTPA